MAKKVLITGMSGLIGGLLKDHLQQAGGYELAALNRRHVEGVTNFQADIADLEAIKPAFEGQGVVVEGAIDAAGLFQASRVLAKHNENYMSVEVKAALDAAGATAENHTSLAEN